MNVWIHRPSIQKAKKLTFTVNPSFSIDNDFYWIPKIMYFRLEKQICPDFY